MRYRMLLTPELWVPSVARRYVTGMLRHQPFCRGVGAKTLIDAVGADRSTLNGRSWIRLRCPATSVAYASRVWTPAKMVSDRDPGVDTKGPPSSEVKIEETPE